MSLPLKTFVKLLKHDADLFLPSNGHVTFSPCIRSTKVAPLKLALLLSELWC